jgi:hypothetical protein
MRGLGRKLCAAALVVATPIVWSSAQQLPGRLDNRRQSSRYSNRSRSARPNRVDGPITYRAKPLPDEYAILLRQSIFSRDHNPTPDPDAQPRQRPNRESQVFLRGVMREGQRFLANIEDTGPNRIKWMSEGDSAPSDRGRIEHITLDHIVIVRGGTHRLIVVGENLDAGKIIDSASADVNSTPANH